jgi:hypothetical protein
VGALAVADEDVELTRFLWKALANWKDARPSTTPEHVLASLERVRYVITENLLGAPFPFRRPPLEPKKDLR